MSHRVTSNRELTAQAQVEGFEAVCRSYTEANRSYTEAIQYRRAGGEQFLVWSFHRSAFHMPPYEAHIQ